MKLIVLSVMLLCAIVIEADAKNDKQYCPTARDDCICTLEYNPVCSTKDCTYGNRCQLKCAGATFAYQGECK